VRFDEEADPGCHPGGNDGALAGDDRRRGCSSTLLLIDWKRTELR